MSAYLTAGVKRCALVFRGCRELIAEDHVLCAQHWNELPEDVKAAYWATKPNSDRRRGELLRLLRVAFDMNPAPEATDG